jgi:hypothetical protein
MRFRKPDRITLTVLAVVVLLLGVGAAVAIGAGETTGTNTACATASTPDHVVGVDSAPVDTITGQTSTSCNTVTYTIPTNTQTVTATVTSTPTTTSTTSTTSTTPTTTTSTTSTTTTTTPPATGCFASPKACGLPDPAAAAGTPGAVGPNAACSSLTPSGSVVASTAGATIQNLNITGTLSITAANVTVTNVCVSANGHGNYETSPSAVSITASGAVIQDSQIGFANSTTQSGQQAVYGQGTLKHDYLLNCGECIWGSPFTVSDSYVNTNAQDYSGGYSGGAPVGSLDHMEALYCSDGTETLTHDTLLNPQDQTAAIFCDTHYGQGGSCDNHISLTNSLAAGGGFTLYPCGNASSVGSSTMNITGNRFARCITPPLTYNPSTGGTACQGSTGTAAGSGADSSGYWPFGGYFGLDAYIFCTGTGQTWSGNVWDDNNAGAGC